MDLAHACPSGASANSIGSLLLAAVAVALLWYVVFPAIDPQLPFNNDGQVTQQDQQPGDGGVARSQSHAGPTVSPRILVIDNYDSFVYNLVQYLGQLGARCEVRRNDEITVAEVGRLRPDGILLSPGPGTPERAGICLRRDPDVRGERYPSSACAWATRRSARPTARPCSRAPELLHGKTSLVHHDGAGVLAGLPDPFTATRYHSLAVVESELPAEIEVTARTASPAW